MNRNQCAAALAPGFDPYAAHPDTGSIFSSIGHAVSSAAKGVAKAAKFVAKPVGKVVEKGLPIVQTVLKNVGPIGMVASGALGAMKAGLSGKNLESIAWAAAEGAAPSGIDKAVGAAHAIRNGSNILKTAIRAAQQQFLPGTNEKLGFDSAIEVLKKSGSKAALGVARRALPSEGAKRAFDAAIGTVSKVAAGTPALLNRAGSLPTVNLGKAKGIISPYAPQLKNAISSIQRNPTLATLHPMVLANKFGTSQQTVLQALRKTGTQRLLPWRSLSPNAMRFIGKWSKAPMSMLGHGTGDTAGLDETGTKYIVAKGDSPFKIALALTGNGNRWVELKALNKDKKPTIDKNVWVGEVLNIPPDWQKPVVKSSAPPVATQTQQSPDRPVLVSTPAPQISTAPGILQAKAMLVAWSKTDGVNQAGVPDYGSTAADLSTSFGPRDSLELQAFQNWSNKTQSGEKLVVDGKLGPKSLAALQHWAESRAAIAVQAPAAVPGSNITTLPEIVIEASAPVTSPGIPQLPSPTPVVSTPTPVVVLPPAPILTPPAAVPVASAPTVPAVVVNQASPAPATEKSKLGPLMAGAAIGGTMFGIPGAIIGAIAGAAIA